MAKDAFSHVTTWIFDLDNTLYPPSVRLFDQIEDKMTRYMMRTLGVDQSRAQHLRAHYWERFGTTLSGLMHEHDIDPDPFLEEVHDISFEALPSDPDLRAKIQQLPGRRIIYTNGTAPYAQQVLKGRQLDGLFDAVYGIEHAGYQPKPARNAFETIFAKDGLDPQKAAMFEDDPRNLKAPHDMGLCTVHVAPTAHPADHIHHHTDDLALFLHSLI